jgi:RimJ/RimL family protein N-acetyltransferase
MRLDQLRKDPTYRPWAPRLIVLRDDPRVIVGNIGFHGPPGTNATRNPTAVEIGYGILEQHRRRGYATEAVGALVEWALEQSNVDRVILSIAPTNEPSLAIARRFGFVEIGRHWDDEDGEELEFELVNEP